MLVNGTWVEKLSAMAALKTAGLYVLFVTILLSTSTRSQDGALDSEEEGNSRPQSDGRSTVITSVLSSASDAIVASSETTQMDDGGDGNADDAVSTIMSITELTLTVESLSPSLLVSPTTADFASVATVATVSGELQTQIEPSFSDYPEGSHTGTSSFPTPSPSDSDFSTLAPTEKSSLTSGSFQSPWSSDAWLSSPSSSDVPLDSSWAMTSTESSLMTTSMVTDSTIPAESVDSSESRSDTIYTKTLRSVASAEPTPDVDFVTTSSTG